MRISSVVFTLWSLDRNEVIFFLWFLPSSGFSLSLSLSTFESTRKTAARRREEIPANRRISSHRVTRCIQRRPVPYVTEAGEERKISIWIESSKKKKKKCFSWENRIACVFVDIFRGGWKCFYSTHNTHRALFGSSFGPSNERRGGKWRFSSSFPFPPLICISSIERERENFHRVKIHKNFNAPVYKVSHQAPCYH